MFGWLKRWWDGPETGDGVGQSLADDARYLVRFRASRRRPTRWRKPTEAETRRWDEHPLLGRFGDFTQAVAEVDGRTWVIRERIWFGWPDPPEHVFFALDGEAVWAAADFDAWPRAWMRPDQSV